MRSLHESQVLQRGVSGRGQGESPGLVRPGEAKEGGEEQGEAEIECPKTELVNVPDNLKRLR